MFTLGKLLKASGSEVLSFQPLSQRSLPIGFRAAPSASDEPKSKLKPPLPSVPNSKVLKFYNFEISLYAAPSDRISASAYLAGYPR